MNKLTGGALAIELAKTETALSMAVANAIGVNTKMHINIRKDERGNAKVEVVSDIICGAALGVFQFAVKSLVVGSWGASVWLRQEDDADSTALAWFELHFQYELQTAGCNGCSAGYCGKYIIFSAIEKYAYGETGIEWRVTTR